MTDTLLYCISKQFVRNTVACFGLEMDFYYPRFTYDMSNNPVRHKWNRFCTLSRESYKFIERNLLCDNPYPTGNCISAGEFIRRSWPFLSSNIYVHNKENVFKREFLFFRSGFEKKLYRIESFEKLKCCSPTTLINRCSLVINEMPEEVVQSDVTCVVIKMTIQWRLYNINNRWQWWFGGG